MSLVNEMLQDLQQRNASDVKPLAGLHVVSNVPAEEPHNPLPSHSGRWLAVTAVAMAALAAWLSWPEDIDRGLLPMQRPQAAVVPANASLPIADSQVATSMRPEDIFAAQMLQLKTTLQLRARPNNVPVQRTRPLVQKKIEKKQTQPAAPLVAATEPTLAATSESAIVLADTPANVKVALPDDQRLRRDGLAALRNNKPAVAEQHFRQWLALDRRNAEAHQLLYESLMARSDIDAARSAMLVALEAVDNSAPFAQTLALDLLSSNRVGQAVLVLQQHRPGSVANLEYEALLAAAQQRAGDHAAAEQVYLGLVQQQPQNGAWWVGLAISQEANGRPDDARNSFATATLAVTLDDTLASYAFERLATLEAGS